MKIKKMQNGSRRKKVHGRRSEEKKEVCKIILKGKKDEE